MIGFDAEIVRSRRKTLVITVREGKVVIRAPLHMPQERILAFAESKQDWILRTLERQKDPRFDPVREGKALLVDGAAVPVFFGAAKNEVREGAYYCKDARAVRRLLLSEHGYLLEEELFSLSRMTGLEPSDVQVRDFSARWGSCGSDKKIKLNWRLLMLPPDLRRYVLIHELCHLRQMNHSRAFWALVQTFCPSYRQCLRRLKEYSFLTGLYR